MIDIIIIGILAAGIIGSIVFGRTDEFGELRKCYQANEALVKGVKKVVYYKYKKSLLWSSWTYYYVHTSNDSFHLSPPILFRFFMPQLLIKRSDNELSEYKKLVRLKKRTVYESHNCSVLLAFEDMPF